MWITQEMLLKGLAIQAAKNIGKATLLAAAILLPAYLLFG